MKANDRDKPRKPVTELILQPASPIYQTFIRLIDRAERVFFAGLPGVGKSLLLQQLVLMAKSAGRRVHLLQWDTARQVFETPKYPLKDGATHPMVIRATGIWLRQALVDWAETHTRHDSLLIGEAPLIGNRLMEIARPYADDAEAMLKSEGTQFAVPVPSREVRKVIEVSRERTIANPQHENETQDAPPDLLRALWQDLHRIAVRLCLAESESDAAPYSPEIYAAVYRHLLQHRHVQILAVDEPLRPSASVYEFDVALPQLCATPAQAHELLARLEGMTSAEQVQAAAARWYEV